MNQALALLLASLAMSGGVLITGAELAGIYNEATAKAARVQAQHDAQLVEAAQLMYQAANGGKVATVEQLVAAGYLKPEFLTREKVDTAPLAVPAE